MAIALKQSTASQEVPLGYFVDSTDGNTEETGLTIANTDIKLWKTGATTLADKNSGGATHIANGIYYTVLDDTDTATLGPMVAFVHVAGALPVRLECVVLPANVYDSGISAGDVLQVDVTQWNGTNVATPTVAGVPEVDVTHVAGSTSDVSTIPASVAAILVDTGTTLQGEVDGIQADTEDLQTTLASVDGKIDTIDNFLDTEIAAILALLDDARAEPGQGSPPVNPDLATKIDYLYKAWRNRSTQTASEYALYADDATTKDHEAACSDDGTTFVRGEVATGA